MKIYQRVILSLLFVFMASAMKVSVATDCNQVTEIPVSECQSLLELYNSTDGANWTNKTGWNQTNTPCSWFGVSCLNGYVQSIDLSKDGVNYTGNNLSGTIPNLNFPRLFSLNLSSNKLVGNIPNFSNLPYMQILSLGANQLTGEIPDFNKLPILASLNLRSNFLTGNIPNFSNLPYLQGIDFMKNLLTGNIPSFSNLPNLGGIYLIDNQLTGEIPNFNLPNLLHLWLSNNKLSGNIPNFNLPKLTQLWLSSNQLSGALPNFNLPQLTQLQLNSNQLTGEIPNFNLPELNELSLQFNQLIGEIPNFNLPKLTHLWINSNQLSGAIPNFNLPKLAWLALSSNRLIGTIPNFTYFNLANLSSIDFSQNCGLTAYDVPQETILNQKNTNWNTKASNCPSSNIIIIPNPGSPGTPGAGVTYTPLTVTKPTNGEILETDVSCNAINCKPFETKLNCGTDCIISYAPSAAVTLTAKPAQGFMVDSWTGCSSISTDTLNCQVIMDAAKSVNVLFKEIPPSSFDLTIKTTGYGTVNSNPTGIDCNSTCIKTYARNISIALIANPAQGFMVDNWQGCDSVSTDKLNCQLAMNATKAVNITFKEIPPPSFELKVQSTGSGSVISNPTGINCNSDCVENYIQNTTVTLTAKPVQGFTIDKWEGCNVDKLSCQIFADRWQSCENIDKLTCQVTMDKAKQVKATFISQAVCNKPKPAAPQMTLSTKNDFVVLASNEIVNADEYILYYAPYSNPPSEVTTNNIGSFSLNSNRSISATLPANTNLYVAVTAKNCAGESGYSNIGTILIPTKLADAPEGYHTAVIPQGYEKISKEQAWIQEKARTAVFSVDLPPQERATALKSIAGITNAICDTASCSITMANGETMSFIKTESLVPKNMDLTALTTNLSSSSTTRRANPRRASISGANCPTGRKALILGSITETFKPSTWQLKNGIIESGEFSVAYKEWLESGYNEAENILKSNGYIVERYSGSQATMEKFELARSKDYAVVLINGHGARNGTIQTGEKLCDKCKLPKDKNNPLLYEVSEVQTGSYIGIKAGWWEGYDLNNKLIHFEGCSLFYTSLLFENSKLPSILLRNNVGVATGYIDFAFVTPFSPPLSLLSALLEESMPFLTAYNQIKNKKYFFKSWTSIPEEYNSNLDRLTFIAHSRMSSPENTLTLAALSPEEYAANYYIDGDVCHVNKYAIQIKGSDGKEIENVVVKIYDSKNQELVKSVQGSTLSKAIFDLSLDPTQTYRMTLSKDGYVTKTVTLDSQALQALTTQTTYTLEKVAPPVLTATAGVETVGLSWNAISGSQFYNLYRKADGDTAFSLLKSNVNAIKYDDANVAAKKYCYKVNTNDNLKNIEGLPSNEICVTPTAKTSTNYTGVDRYVAYDDGTAYDKVTGLTWMRCSVGQIWNATTKQCDGQAMTFTYFDAIKQTNNFAGYNNWRLPELEELSSLMFCSGGTPAYFPAMWARCSGTYSRPTTMQSIFPNIPNVGYYGQYWSKAVPNCCNYYYSVLFYQQGNDPISYKASPYDKFPIRLVLKDKTTLSGSAGTETISLGWSNAVAVKGNKTYNLYRKIDGEANFTLLKPNLTEITYTDTNLAIKRHCYKVDVSGVASTTSNEFCITPAAKPKACQASAWVCMQS